VSCPSEENFDLTGNVDEQEIRMTFSGWGTQFREHPEYTTWAHACDPAASSRTGLTLYTNLTHVATDTVLAAFTFLNPADLAINADVLFDDNDDAPIQATSDGRGLVIHQGEQSIRLRAFSFGSAAKLGETERTVIWEWFGLRSTIGLSGFTSISDKTNVPASLRRMDSSSRPICRNVSVSDDIGEVRKGDRSSAS
jgi:hypothetical protein